MASQEMGDKSKTRTNSNNDNKNRQGSFTVILDFMPICSGLCSDLLSWASDNTNQFDVLFLNLIHLSFLIELNKHLSLQFSSATFLTSSHFFPILHLD
jgi:hypothetical protein